VDLRRSNGNDALIEDDVRAFFTRHAECEGTAPLTAETFARIAGELETAYRLAWLKRQTLTLPARQRRPPVVATLVTM
jgi:hypothetical protein